MGQLDYTAEEVNELLGKVKVGGGNTGSSNTVIPMAVLMLTNDSTSDEILAAFGGKDEYLSFVQSVVNNKDGAVVIVYDEMSDHYTYNIGMLIASYTDENNSNIQMEATMSGAITTLAVYMTDGQAIVSGNRQELLLGDAPNDGKTYGQKNGLWAEIEASSDGSDNIITIPTGILELTSESSSDEVFAAFGGKSVLIDLCKKAQSEDIICVMKVPGHDTDISVFTPFMLAADYTDVNNALLAMMFLNGGAIMTMQIYISDGIASFGSEDLLFITSDSVINDLITTSEDSPLSASMGKKLNDEKVASSDVRTIKTLTQSEYDSISKDKKTLYIITDTGKIYLGSIPITGV